MKSAVKKASEFICEENRDKFIKDCNEGYGDFWLSKLSKRKDFPEDLFKELEEELNVVLPLSKKAYELFYDFNIEVRLYNYVKDETTGEILGYNVIFEWYSNAGEDICDETELPINFTDKDLYEFFNNLYHNFDVDDHVEPLVEMRGRNGVPNSIKELVEDAESIEETYGSIANQLFNIVHNK